MHFQNLISQMQNLLTESERALCWLIAQGHTMKDIANSIDAHFRLIEARKNKLLKRVCCTNSANLIHWCHVNQQFKNYENLDDSFNYRAALFQLREQFSIHAPQLQPTKIKIKQASPGA